MIAADGERHQLFERHVVLGIDVEQCRRHAREPQPLLDDGGGDEERRRDLLLAHALLAHGEKRAELVERMQRRALDILGEAVLLGHAVLADDAGDRRVAGQALLLDQQFERAKPAAAGGHLVDAGLGTVVPDDGANGQALQQRASGDVLGELLDADARLDVADVRLGEHQFIEGDVARGAERDLLDGFGHGASP